AVVVRFAFLQFGVTTLQNEWLPQPPGRSVAPVPPARVRGRATRTLLCFSHLRWNFVFQRPQHLMTRFARDYRVIFWEEPISAPLAQGASLERKVDEESGVTVVTPLIPDEIQGQAREEALRALLDACLAREKGELVRWYYTPMMLNFSRHLEAVCTVYDCMDELANFKFAPPELTRLERELLGVADVVFTGGYSLYEAK